MPSYVALLRAVNLGATNAVPMARLRELFDRLGYPEARTLLQSGNVVFRSDSEPADRLESRLEKAIASELGVETRVFLRSAAEWKSIISRNPFRREATSDPGHLLMLALDGRPAAGRLESLQAAIVGAERVALVGRELYAVYPDGIGRSRLTNSLIERSLGIVATGRNWNTVQKLSALLES
jgi:uncharacterized protein (DUF1697 family)